MSNTRIKTKKELIREFGNVWFLGFEIDQKNLLPYLGELIKQPKLREGIRISTDLLTDELLLPLGTIVYVPFTKSIGESLKNSASFRGAVDNILYYKGFNKKNGYHKLSSYYRNELDDLGGDYFTASEILEGYDRYQLKGNFPLLDALMKYNGN